MASQDPKLSELAQELKQKNAELARLNRALEIETALEKVRAGAMAMRSSAELAETSSVLFHQIKELNIHVIRTGVGIFDDANNAMELWLTTFTESNEVIRILDYVNLRIHPVFENIIPARKEKKPYAITVLKGPEVKKYYTTMSTYLSLPQQQTYNPQESFYSFFFSEGAINVIATQTLTEEECNIMSRFANVFGVIYTRFLDLQKAEDQALQAKIETSLERLRSKALAMHSTKDLDATLNSIFKELGLLELVPIHSAVTIINEESRTAQSYVTSATSQGVSVEHTWIQLDSHPVLSEALAQWKLKQEYWPVLYGEEIGDFYRAFTPPAQVKFRNDDAQHGYFIPFEEGSLMVWLDTTASDSELRIFRRFTTVLGLTYRRHLDLQESELQAREAEVEAALERVRAKAMGMHNSHDLAETISVFYRELRELSETPRRIGVAVIDKETRMAELSTTSTAENGESVEGFGNLKMSGHWLLDDVYDHWLRQEEYHGVLRGNQIKEYYQVLKPQISYPDYSNDVVQYGYYFMFPEGDVVAWTEKELQEEELKIYRRFTSVISLTYRRYKDLQRAEAQTREAIIEASLERVRGKAMAMHSSADLAATIGVFYRELESLSLTPRRCGVGLIDKETRLCEVSAMSKGEAGGNVETIGVLKLEGHPVLEGIYDNWLLNKEYHPVLRGNEIQKYNQLLRPQVPFPDLHDDMVQYGYFFFFDEGGVYAYTEKEMGDGELKIYRRFTSVLSLTYKRYKDLMDAEARSRQAIREASLDRVRAEIASMRTAEDLKRIMPLIWRELKTLGVPFFRCGLMIANEKDQFVDFYLSTPEDKPLAALHLGFDSVDVVRNTMKHWRQQTVYKDHWNREQFAAFAKSMMEQGQIQETSSYQGGDQPPESLILQFIPFVQGMLYIGSAEPLTDSQIELAQTLAEAFSTAYARYEDFTKLEAAKAQVENTLKELRVTQNQLVQSEKMASLGELTAGIAHEIQNPLNFVNNFSEVSKELLDEMNEELAKGNADGAREIATGLVQNLEKITFHGKRADAIVKSMLQHSRKSTGQKEPTDINDLCDEYVRLSYHGLRAKDKSFNAKFETEFDPFVEKINVMPQDIGRVVLNLINNAFYAVNEKKKSAPDGYEPTVTVSTHKVGKTIEIKVRDNGNGIPAKVLEKVFQPFFTTKPSGQGTGLGLSLSYDIVTKGHGGELKVETHGDGEPKNPSAETGATFTISLPVT